MAAALALVGLLATRSRGAWLGLVAGAAVLLVLRWGTLPPVARRRAALGAAGAALVATAVFAWRLGEDDPYRWTRTRIWGAAVRVWRADPWLGCGPGQYPVAAALVRFPDPVGPLRWERRGSRFLSRPP